MTPADPREIANHTDRVRRPMVLCKEGVVVADFPGGWLSVRRGDENAPFPSASSSRVYWLRAAGPLRESDVESARRCARAHGGSRVFAWIPPWACDQETENILARAGASRWQHVEYIALVRAAEPCAPARPSPYDVRALAPGEALDTLDQAGAWYGSQGVGDARRMVDRGIVEIHAAFDGSRPVALGLLVMDGSWAYLGAAGTAEEARGRGAQSGLICSRVTRALELGATSCCCETNTAVPISLRNLERCGFEARINWHVYQWNLDPAHGS